jgi:catechol 2,3-dioxygenase-like lactoylglutathione lyase family enzyme
MTPDAPRVDCDNHHACMPVRDARVAHDYYVERLGFRPGFLWGDPPAFAGVDLGKVRIFLEGGASIPGAGTAFFDVGDVDELYAYHQSSGVTIVSEPGDRPYGVRDYTVHDPDGNALTFGTWRPATEPAIPIERVAVPVRLERRIAAVLADLAAAKGMTIDSCLEETLLHTFEPLGLGVASPHTAGELRLIQELKKKHGIDYDSHGSYRFVER